MARELSRFPFTVADAFNTDANDTDGDAASLYSVRRTQGVHSLEFEPAQSHGHYDTPGDGAHAYAHEASGDNHNAYVFGQHPAQVSFEIELFNESSLSLDFHGTGFVAPSPAPYIVNSGAVALRFVPAFGPQTPAPAPPPQEPESEPNLLELVIAIHPNDYYEPVTAGQSMAFFLYLVRVLVAALPGQTRLAMKIAFLTKRLGASFIDNDVTFVSQDDKDAFRTHLQERLVCRMTRADRQGHVLDFLHELAARRELSLACLAPGSIPMCSTCSLNDARIVLTSAFVCQESMRTPVCCECATRVMPPPLTISWPYPERPRTA